MDYKIHPFIEKCIFQKNEPQFWRFMYMGKNLHHVNPANSSSKSEVIMNIIRTKWKGIDVSQNLLTFLVFCGDFLCSSGSGTLTLYPVLVSDIKDKATVIHKMARRPRKKTVIRCKVRVEYVLFHQTHS